LICVVNLDQDRHLIAFPREVDSGSRKENASKKKERCQASDLSEPRL